jgi:hypothetical protein
MTPPEKNAWLIGLYTTDIEHRIESLGYRLIHCYAGLDFQHKGTDAPALIVFSEDEFSNPDWMFSLRNSYPESVMISMPIHAASYPHSVNNNPGKSSIRRLIFSIQERLHRWDN